MRKLLVAFAVLGLFAMVADAHSIQFYFGAPAGGTFPTDDGYPQPDAGPSDTVTLGVWAVPAIDWGAGAIDIWQGININVVTTGGVTVDSIAMDNSDHNPSPFATAFRWEGDSDLGGTDGNFYLVGVQTYGVGGLLPSELGGTPPDMYSYFDGEMGSGVLRYWLGDVTLTGAGAEGDVFLQVGDGGIARRGGVVATDMVYFGLDGDAGLSGEAFGAMTPTPEFHFTPEPASLILLSLAGLFLRRR